MTHPRIAVGVALLVLGLAPPARAQMVSATTGAINGRVTDDKGAPLAGATITIYSPAMMGLQTAASNRDGRYRFPALNPGSYKLACQRDGYSNVIFDRIAVSLGFTATVNVALSARIQDTVSLADQGPVLDVQSQRTATTADAAKLAAQPTARNMWAILEQTPAVRMGNIDVGGSRAGSQTGYSTYDAKGGQNRVVLDGMVTTEGTGSIGIYFDYGAIAESSTGTAGQNAEMSWPGVHSQYIAKAGGGEYHGSIYTDYENKDIQSYNVDDEQIARGAEGRDANRLHSWSIVNADVGGYLKRDTAWWYFGFRRNDVQSRLVNFPVKPQQTTLYNYSGKVSYKLSPNNKVIAYAQWALKQQPFRLASFVAPSALYRDGGSTTSQRHWSWVWKGEWDRVLNDSMYFELRAGQFGYDWPLVPNGPGARIEDIGTGVVSGATRDWQQNRRRNQVLGSLTLFRDGWFGNHNFKFGGELFRETESEFYRHGWGDNDTVNVLRNGAPIEVYLFETPSSSDNGLWTYGAYAADIWQIGDRLVVSPGLRFDRYRAFLPEQEHPAGRWNPTPQHFDAVGDVIDYNLFGPRIGATYDVGGHGKTVLKAFYGTYWWNIGTDFLFNVNPNSIVWWRRYAWSDTNRSGVWDPGEEGRLLATQGGRASEALDPDTKDTYTREATLWLERELMPNFSLRAGFVYRGIRQNRQRVNANQPFEAFTVPVTITDPGPDGIRGNADDGKAIQGYNLDPSFLSLQPYNVTRNVADQYDYYNLEVTANRRFTRGWSLLAAYAMRWNRDNGPGSTRANSNVLTPNDLINTEQDGRYHYTYWSGKLQATYDAPWGVRVSPVLRAQAGQQWGRTFVATMNYGSIRVLAEPLTARRQDNIVIFDVRVEKRLALPLRPGARLGVLVDFFNLFNANPVESLQWSSGSSFLRPTAIVPPRIVRFGAKLDW